LKQTQTETSAGQTCVITCLVLSHTSYLCQQLRPPGPCLVYVGDERSPLV
jgi:hypothetical protein